MAWFGMGAAKGTKLVDGTGRFAAPTLAPAPVAPLSLLGPTTPADAGLAASTATLAAQQAAKKQRGKAGSTRLTGGLAGGAPSPVQPVLAPKTLLGA